MQFNEDESRVVVAALQSLDRQVADDIEKYAEPTHEAIPPTLRSALDRHDIISNLTKKLATAGDHEVDEREVNLTIEGLDRYLELLNDAQHENGDSNDFLLSPDMKAREHELQRSSQLLARLTRGRLHHG